jgi:transcriptional regulator with XRE-family HTH domain
MQCFARELHAIARICREKSNLTRESAAENAKFSVRALAEYELGDREISPRVAAQIGESYGGKWWLKCYCDACPVKEKRREL